MAAKSSVRDTARVLNLPLFEADRLAKLIPDTSLKNIFGLDAADLSAKLKDNQESIAMANQLIDISKGNDLPAKVRSEEHTSELQSRPQLVCRLLLDKQ